MTLLGFTLHRRHTAGALALAMLLLAAAVPRADEPPPFPRSDRLPLDRWREYLAMVHAPGIAVIVVADTGVVATACLGERDVEHHRPVIPETRFYIASCTKTFVATALASLASDGRIDLDAPVRRADPRFRIDDPGLTDSLTVRDLLCHRYGLTSSPLQFATANTGLMSDTLFDRLLARVRPLRRFRYSNLHYLIAGRVIEARTGRRWQDVLAERVFAPAGLRSATTSASTLYGDTAAALPYEWSGDGWRPAVRKTDRTMHAAGGMGLSLADAGRWLRIQLGEGTLDGRRIFPAAMLESMRVRQVTLDDHHPIRADQVRTGWSAGWELRDLAGEPMLTHSGSFKGAAAHLSILPRRRLGVAVFANANVPPLTEWIAAEAYDWAMNRPSPDVRATVTRLLARQSAGAPADSAKGALSRPASAYAGRYANADWGAIDVRVRDDGVAFRWGDFEPPVVLTGPDRFVLDGDTPGRFELDAAGRVQAIRLVMSAPDSVSFERSGGVSR